jgi:nucleoside-diphosphate-sugar epimerase
VPWVCRELIERRVDSFQFTRSTGESVFEFLHIVDAVEAILRAAAAGKAGIRVFQFGPGEHSRTSVRDLVQLISRLYDGRWREIHMPKGVYERAVNKFLAVEQTKEQLGWASTWHLEEGLRQTLQWYSANIAHLIPAEDQCQLTQERN